MSQTLKLTLEPTLKPMIQPDTARRRRRKTLGALLGRKDPQAGPKDHAAGASSRDLGRKGGQRPAICGQLLLLVVVVGIGMQGCGPAFQSEQLSKPTPAAAPEEAQAREVGLSEPAEGGLEGRRPDPRFKLPKEGSGAAKKAAEPAEPPATKVPAGSPAQEPTFVHAPAGVGAQALGLQVWQKRFKRHLPEQEQAGVGGAFGGDFREQINPEVFRARMFTREYDFELESADEVEAGLRLNDAQVWIQKLLRLQDREHPQESREFFLTWKSELLGKKILAITATHETRGLKQEGGHWLGPAEVRFSRAQSQWFLPVSALVKSPEGLFAVQETQSLKLTLQVEGSGSQVFEILFRASQLEPF